MANTGLNYPKTTAFTTVIKFDQPLRDMGSYEVTGALNFTINSADAQAGFGTFVELVANGTNVPTFHADYKNAGTGAYDNTDGVTNLIIFFRSPSSYCYMISPLGVVSEGGGEGDVTPPGATSYSVEDAEPNKVLIGYGEALDSGSVPDVGDYVIEVNGSPRTVTNVAIIGSSVKVTFDGAAVVAGDDITLDYTPGANPIQDAAGNDATAIVGGLVDNNVIADTLEDLTLSTNDGYTNTAQVFTATTPVAGWGKKGLDPKHLAAGTDGYIQCEYHADAEPMAFGFNTANSMDSGQASIDFGFIYFTGQCYPLKNNGTMTTAFSISDGDIMRVRRSGGSTMILEISTDGGSTWDTTGVVDPLFSTNSGDLYVISDINNTGKIYYPKGYGLV